MYVMGVGRGWELTACGGESWYPNKINLFFMIFPCMSHHCKLVPVQYRVYEYGVLRALFRHVWNPTRSPFRPPPSLLTSLSNRTRLLGWTNPSNEVEPSHGIPTIWARLQRVWQIRCYRVDLLRGGHLCRGSWISVPRTAGFIYAIRAKWPIRPELIPVSVAWSVWEYFYFPLDGI